MRAEAVARFRLTTGHDLLRVYLHWQSHSADEACLLCGHLRIDGDHQFQCTGLDEYPMIDDVVSWYWEDGQWSASNGQVAKHNSLAEIVEVEIEVVSSSIVPSGNFAELKSYCHGAQGQRQAYLLPMPR
ncbi:reverse transcriptase [Trichonephila clavipes]|nr:reverse transcriptase [Trichonephila clavipes]